MSNEKLVKDFIDYCNLRRFSQDTIRNYSSTLRSFLFSFVGKRPFEISDKMIEEYLLNISGYSNRRTHHSVVKLFYRKVLKCKFKLQYIPYGQKEEKLPIHVNKEEFLKMVSVCNNEKHRLVISLLFDSGIRISELINLRMQDIDESNMLINIIQAKGNKDRKVKMSNVLLMLINSYKIKYTPKVWLFNGQKKRIDTPDIIRQYTKRSCEEVVVQLRDKAGITKKFTPHKFRHGYAMALLENGATLDEIGNQLGHNSKKTTEIYARMNNKVIQKIESPLEQIMKENNLLLTA